ncbi:MAG: hypothetical protein ABSF18_07695 [Gammaproteobacteria bacterium]|jgi:hypothetical protein
MADVTAVPDGGTGGPAKPGAKPNGLKKIPMPVLIGGGLVVVLGIWYLKNKSAQSAAATAAQNATATPTSQTGLEDTSGYGDNSGYDNGYAAGSLAAGSGSGGIDPTDLASIIAALQPQGSTTGSGSGTSSTTPNSTGGTPSSSLDPNITVNVTTNPGGGPPSSTAPGVVVAGGSGGTTGNGNVSAPLDNNGSPVVTPVAAAQTAPSSVASQPGSGTVPVAQLTQAVKGAGGTTKGEAAAESQRY